MSDDPEMFKTLGTIATDAGSIADRARAAQKLVAPEGPGAIVKAGENLQAALAAAALAGKAVQTEDNAIFEERIKLPTGSRLVFGAGSGVHGVGEPAVWLRAGFHDVKMGGGRFTSTHADVLAFGENTANQKTVESAPHGVHLIDCLVPTHRGRRGYSLHAADVTLDNCQGLDIWHIGSGDTQGVYILNGPGPYRITGGRYQAASENFLAGGDRPQIPNMVPADITIDGVEFDKPDSMRGVSCNVKNNVEFKSARRFAVRNCRVHGCWRQGQDGVAFTLTPAGDGEDRVPVDASGIVEDGVIEDNLIWDVAAIFQVVGRNVHAYTERPLNNVSIRRNIVACDRIKNVGTGQFLSIAGEVAGIEVVDNVGFVDGSSLVYAYRGTVIEKDGVKHGGQNLGRVVFSRNWTPMGKYGFNIDGAPNSGTGQLMINTLEVAGNQFSGGDAAQRKTLPSNTYLTAAAFEASPVVVAARATLAAALAG